MDRSRAWPILLVLGLLVLLGAPAGLVVAQEEQEEPPVGDDSFGGGISVTTDNVENEFGIQQYDVVFEAPGAFIPQRPYPEPYTVVVVEGTLAFRVDTPNRESSGVFVEPSDGRDLETLVAEPPVQPDGSDLSTPHAFDSAGTVPCEEVPGAGKLCEVPLNEIVRLLPGDVINVPSNSVCFLCNTTEIPGPSNDTAKILVFAPPQFSWQQSDIDEPGLSTVDRPHASLGWSAGVGTRCQ